MPKFLQLAIWNSNGLSQHRDELKVFLHTYDIDIMLISETHFTVKTHFRIPYYTVHHTNHPNRTARGGTAIIIKNSNKHHPLNSFNQHSLQSTRVSIIDTYGPLTLSAVYLPPQQSIHQQQLEDFFHSMGPRFIAGGDYTTPNIPTGAPA
jgi:exonuclease III